MSAAALVELHPDEAMAGLKAAVIDFCRRDQSVLSDPARGAELQELRKVMNALEQEFSSSARTFQQHSYGVSALVQLPYILWSADPGDGAAGAIEKVAVGLGYGCGLAR